ncbi:MAG: hypothetical protein EX330_10355 [Candidatus Brocadia sp. BROELEC01]|nr:hypothetical protein [Candidatus Brocadia sapporoensis]RZV57264.1 MAG: hypothetical protein EX330_10355 [Candidatus Brocadia sp. BROELEC01]
MKPAISNSVSRLTIEFILFAADGKVGCFPREYRKKISDKKFSTYSMGMQVTYGECRFGKEDGK